MGPNDGWPEHFRCLCRNGAMWWNLMQAHYRCSECSSVMVLDKLPGLVATWVDGERSDPKLTRDQAVARAPTDVPLITLG